ncbi:glycosyltransferase family 2 protein [Acuticoccus sp.]|uniref:glycosyltransferase family 2 protein n=1 Tax=Acuticoccus sp. TaxID=1904378 RepID=UPI003B524087
MTVSILTLVRGRERQLANLVAGLAAQDRPVDELVVAAMQATAPTIDAPFPVRTVVVPGERLPLAAARNAAANLASGSGLVFLDVDCVPAPGLLATYADHLAAVDGCLMGEVRYLPFVPGVPLDLAKLYAAGVRHPAKPAPPPTGLAREEDYGELWGLSFALRRTAFVRVGGFDEGYVGYGSEETDFARRLEAAGVPLYRVAGALAFHQHHAVHVPPLQHFADIVANARRYHRAWGRWSMEYWLGQLAERSYVRWRADGDDLTVLRTPTCDEVTASAVPDALFS